MLTSILQLAACVALVYVFVRGIIVILCDLFHWLCKVTERTHEE